MATQTNRIVTIRPATPNDRPFVLATWERSYGSSPTARSLGIDYKRIWRPLIERLWRRSADGAGILVATLPDAPDLIVGWLVAEPIRRVVHYVYVRGKTSAGDGLQRAGVATALLDALPCRSYVVTHSTELTEAIRARWSTEERVSPPYEVARLFE